MRKMLHFLTCFYSSDRFTSMICFPSFERVFSSQPTYKMSLSMRRKQKDKYKTDHLLRGTSEIPIVLLTQFDEIGTAGKPIVEK